VGASHEVRRVLRGLGARIRTARIDAGLSQEQAAAQAAIDYKRWQRLEEGSVNPTVRTLVRVAAALGLSFWELLAPTIER
jgi:transcriptional regulator with XRE-family HTH domain